MKIAVVGYGEMFSNLVLGALESGNKVVGVMRYERTKYNSFVLFLKDIFCAGKDISFIKSLKLHEIKAKSVNSEDFKNEILKLNPDIILVGSWGEKFSRETINLPKIGTVNCHPSLLPKYRGPNPYIRVIDNGEELTGVTFHLMNEKFDAGAVLLQKKIPVIQGVNGDTGATLKNKCCNLARCGAAELFANLDREIIIPIPQSDKDSTYYPQVGADDMVLDFRKTASEINRKIRAMTPWQSVFVPHGEEFFKVGEHEIKENTTEYKKYGTIVEKSKNSFSVLCSDGKIVKFKKPKLFGKLKRPFTNFYIKFFVKTGDLAK